MKIFISWSGYRSQKVAELLDEWLKCVIQAVKPWISSRDIDKGSLWFNAISNELADIQNGIICLTKSNLNKPWILFESGALAKGLNSNRVFTFLIDLKEKDVKDPLAQFNHTLPEKNSMCNLIRSINKNLDENALSDAVLTLVFETYWPQFEKKFSEILNATSSEDNTIIDVPQEDLLEEVLSSVRSIDRRLRQLETNEKEKSERRPSSIMAKQIIANLVDSDASDDDILRELMKLGFSRTYIQARIDIARNKY